MSTKAGEQDITAKEELVSSHIDSPLPPYDPGHGSRNACIIGLIVTFAFSFFTIGWFVYVYYDNTHYWLPIPTTVDAELLKLSLTLVVLLATECAGFIHTASLRWGLYEHERLQYNSNIRLFTTVKGQAVNSWWANLLLAVSLIVAFASAQVASSPSTLEYTTIIPVSLLVLGVCLLIHAVMASICLYDKSNRIKTFGSNPLNTTLACLHHQLERQPGRLVFAVDASDTEQYSSPSKLRTSQPSMRAADRGIRHVIRYSWTLVPMSLVWALVVFAIAYKLDLQDCGTIDGCEDSGGQFVSDPHPMFWAQNVQIDVAKATLQQSADRFPPTVVSLVTILLLCVFQAFATMGLHLAELIVNRSRDEAAWRQAENLKSGAVVGWRSLIVAFTSWQTLMLSAFKVLVHWLFGQSITLADAFVGMSYLPVLILSGTALVLAIVITIMAKYKPKGYVPAAHGHIQTLANLIDNWGQGTRKNNRLFWGDKGGVRDDIRSVGTSADASVLKKIDADAFYES